MSQVRNCITGVGHQHFPSNMVCLKLGRYYVTYVEHQILVGTARMLCMQMVVKGGGRGINEKNPTIKG